MVLTRRNLKRTTGFRPILTAMAGRAPILTPGICDERRRLNDDFVQAVREVMELHDSEIRTLLRGKAASRFDIALQAAQRNRERAKRRLLRHITEHGCHVDWAQHG